MLFHQRDNHFWVVSRSYMALWSDWKQAENDKIILPNDLGWEGGEQLIFIMFINIFGHNAIFNFFFLVIQEIAKLFVATCVSNISNYVFMYYIIIS